MKDRRSRPDQWQVLLQDHHEGYISWPEYLTNQAQAGAEPECAGRGRIGCGSSGQRTTGRTGALRPLRTKDARPVQRPPLS